MSKRFLVRCRAWDRARFFIFVGQLGCASEALLICDRMGVKWYHTLMVFHIFHMGIVFNDINVISSIALRNYE